MAKNIVEKVEKAIWWIDLSANEVSSLPVSYTNRSTP